MPTITIGELRHLIESTSYDKYARGGRSEVRGRPPSASTKRDRSRSRSRTRLHQRSQSADKRSRLQRPQSATVVLHYHPQKQGQNTPTKRPESAKSVTCVPRQDGKKMDFTGLSNMMKSMSFSQSSNRGWKSKSVDFSETEKKSKISGEKGTKAEKTDIVQTKPVDMTALRKNRSSNFSKFKYPLTNHQLQRHRNRMYIEENIPTSLRRLPKYSNQPRRKNCSYNPPGLSVTRVKQHNILSKSLPPPPPNVSTHDSVPSSKVTPQSENDGWPNNKPFPTEAGDQEEELQRNATYHYVHNGEAEETLVLPGDDEEVEFRTPRELSPVPPVIVTVQDTPRDSSARQESDRGEKLPDIVEDNHEKEADKQSHASDDSFLVQNAMEEILNGNNDMGPAPESEKHSYGDINDLESIPSEFSVHSPTQEKASGFKAKPHLESSDDEIEEDIPEEVNVKTISFTNQKRARSSKH